MKDFGHLNHLLGKVQSDLNDRLKDLDPDAKPINLKKYKISDIL